METQTSQRTYYTGNGERYEKAEQQTTTIQGNIWTERNWWRRGVFAALALLFVAGLIIVSLSKRPSHEPVFITQNREGQFQVEKWEDYDPTAEEIKQDLIRLMRCIRGVPTDAGVLEYCWKIVPLFLLERTQALAQVQAFYKSLKPQEVLFKKRIDLEDMKGWREPDGRWRLEWTEHVYGFQNSQGVGKREMSERMSSVIEIKRQKPTTRKQIEYKGEPVNPRGVYPISIGWGN